MTERLTIDLDLRFDNVRSGLQGSMHDGVIIELKQEGHVQTLTKELLKSLRIKPMRISKYAIGTAVTDLNIKRGNFMVRVRKIEKIINKPIH